MVADLATIRENVSVGEHTIVGRGAAIENACTIGSYCKLETKLLHHGLLASRGPRFRGSGSTDGKRQLRGPHQGPPYVSSRA